MDMVSLIIGMKLGGGGLPLGEATSEYHFYDQLDLSWETNAEENE